MDQLGRLPLLVRVFSIDKNAFQKKKLYQAPTRDNSAKRKHICPFQVCAGTRMHFLAQEKQTQSATQTQYAT